MKEHYWVWSRGKRLSVMEHRPEGAAADTPVAVICHGFTGDKIGTNQLNLNLALALEAAGFAAVRFDYAGSGDSEGDFATDTFISGWKEDLESVLAWERTRFPLAPVILYGHSLGGLIVLTRRDAGDIAARVLFAPVVKPVENFREVIVGPEGWRAACEGREIANFYGKGFRLKGQFVAELLREGFDPLAAAAGLETPLLLVHGSADAAVPIGGSAELLAVYKGPKEYRVLDMDHVATGRQAELLAEIVEWLVGWRRRQGC